MDPIYYLVSFGLAGLFVLWVGWSNKKKARRLNAVMFAAVKRRAGGRVVSAEVNAPAVELRQGPLCVNAWVRRTSKMESLYVSARFVAGSGPRFTALPRGSLGRGDALGIDPKFDHRFVVKTDDPDGTRLHWAPDARRLFYVLADRSSWGEAWIGAIDGEVRSDGETITFARSQAFKSPDGYESAFRLVSILAGAPLEVIDAEAETGRRLHSSP